MTTSRISNNHPCLLPRLLCLTTAVTLSAWLWPAHAIGQATPATSFNLQVPVPLVVEDVVVLDRDGQPVHGLKASDLTVTENGQPVTLRNFEAYETRTNSQGPAPKLPDLGPNVFTNVSAASTDDTLNILLLDALNTPMADQVYVRQEMLKYLKKLQPGTRIAIFGLGTRLYLLQGFTSDPAVLQTAIDMKAKARSSVLLGDPVSGGPVEQMSDILSGTIGSDPTTASIIANVQDFESEQETNIARLRMIYTLQAMNQLARYLSVLPGRKNLIWFSGSFPLNFLPDETATDPFNAVADFEDDVRKTTNLLSRSRVAVYPVDGRGLFTNPAFSASQSGSSFVMNHGNQRGSYAYANNKFFDQISAEHATMDMIAENTGGKAFYDTNGLQQAVEKAINYGENYYTLSYIPPKRNWDGGYRKISVKIDRPDLKLSYRHAYFADDPNASTHGNKVLPQNAMQVAMMRGGPAGAQILFDAMVVPSDNPDNKITQGTHPDPKLMKPPYQTYLLQYLVDIRNVAFSVTPRGIHQFTLQFEAVVYDADGQIVNSTGSTLSLNLPADQYQQELTQGLRARQVIEAPAKGEYFLRLGIHDLTTDRIGVIEIPTSSLKSKQTMIDAARNAHPNAGTN